MYKIFALITLLASACLSSPLLAADDAADTVVNHQTTQTDTQGSEKSYGTTVQFPDVSKLGDPTNNNNDNEIGIKTPRGRDRDSGETNRTLLP